MCAVHLNLPQFFAIYQSCHGVIAPRKTLWSFEGSKLKPTAAVKLHIWVKKTHLPFSIEESAARDEKFKPPGCFQLLFFSFVQVRESDVPSHGIREAMWNNRNDLKMMALRPRQDAHSRWSLHLNLNSPAVSSLKMPQFLPKNVSECSWWFVSSASSYSWWLNQPSWKNMQPSNWIMKPQFVGVKIKKHLSCQFNSSYSLIPSKKPASPILVIRL